ncbi:MAG: hypothetical protein ABR991_07690 [Terracidiphilus sp.]|jgi:hypothetical protein
MPLLDQIREKNLIKLAKTRFDPELMPAEFKVLHDSASSEDPSEPDEKAPQPPVRAEFLRWLTTDPEAASHIDPKGLRVYAATIFESLDLKNCYVIPTLDFTFCNFPEKINLLSAETRGLFFFNSSLIEGIRADGIIVHGQLVLHRIQSEGEIRLLSAVITGQFVCNGTKLKTRGNALHADGAKIGGDVFLCGGFESEGLIRFLGVQIEGDLSCTDAKLNAKGKSLSVDGSKINGNIFLEKDLESEGEIRLIGTEIGKDLSFSGAKVTEVSCQIQSLLAI